MNHWHLCDRWTNEGLPCPYGRGGPLHEQIRRRDQQDVPDTGPPGRVPVRDPARPTPRTKPARPGIELPAPPVLLRPPTPGRRPLPTDEAIQQQADEIIKVAPRMKKPVARAPKVKVKKPGFRAVPEQPFPKLPKGPTRKKDRPARPEPKPSPDFSPFDVPSQLPDPNVNWSWLPTPIQRFAEAAQALQEFGNDQVSTNVQLDALSGPLLRVVAGMVEETAASAYSDSLRGVTGRQDDTPQDPPPGVPATSGFGNRFGYVPAAVGAGVAGVGFYINYRARLQAQLTTGGLAP